MPTGLANILTEVAELDAQKERVNAELKRISARRDRLEQIAVDEMLASGLSGAKVAGRSWRVEHDHHCSVTAENRDAVLALARMRDGWEEAITSVNTSRLRALLKSEAESSGKSDRNLYTDGTEFHGLVGEYVQMKLRHRTV